MITDKILIIKNLDKRQIEVFSNYSAYQEWLMDRANPIKRPWLAWQFTKERNKEARLEKKYGLPQFSLRGVLYYLSYKALKDILAKASAQQHSLSTVVKTIHKVANTGLSEEPYPIKLPITAVITSGDEIGSVYHFSDYNSYLGWRIAQATFLKKWKLLKKDAEQRKLELLVEVQFNRPPNYFRGIYNVDYKSVIPERHSKRRVTKESIFERAVQKDFDELALGNSVVAVA